MAKVKKVKAPPHELEVKGSGKESKEDKPKVDQAWQGQRQEGISERKCKPQCWQQGSLFEQRSVRA